MTKNQGALSMGQRQASIPMTPQCLVEKRHEPMHCMILNRPQAGEHSICAGR